jgi:intracellular sulfur oxidation DsrE/DsrF family protein
MRTGAAMSFRAPIRRTCAVAALGLAFGASAIASEQPAPTRVVYHVDGGLEQASRALRSIRNQLEVDPQALIVVVAIGPGIDFLLEGAVDAGGYPYELIVEQLVAQQVRFVACGNTLQAKHLTPDKLLPEAGVVHSGIAEIARLQFRERHAYIKP